MIPSNITVKEFIKYYAESASKEEITKQFERLVDELDEARRQLQSNERRQESVEEQLMFARDLVTNINEQVSFSHKEARKNTKEWHLANYIACEIENSYFEL